MTSCIAKLSLVAVIWGGSFIAGRVAAQEMAPTTAALVRYVVASLSLLAMAFAMERGLPRLDRRQWIIVAAGLSAMISEPREAGTLAKPTMNR